MTWPQLQTYFKGKVFLIGITFMDQENRIVEEYETSGSVETLTDDGLLIFKRADGSMFQIPYESETIHTAAKGDYKEKGTGNIIVDPDFMTIWKIRVNDTDNLDELKSRGYIA